MSAKVCVPASVIGDPLACTAVTVLLVTSIPGPNILLPTETPLIPSIFILVLLWSPFTVTLPPPKFDVPKKPVGVTLS